MQAKDFHAKCDRKGPTITFIQLKNGPLIGGFTTAHWKNCRESDFVNDRYSFIFKVRFILCQINKRKLYKLLSILIYILL